MNLILIAIFVFILYILYNPSKDIDTFKNYDSSLRYDKVYKKNVDLDYFDRRDSRKLNSLRKITSNQIPPITDASRGKLSKGEDVVAALPTKATTRRHNLRKNEDDKDYIIPMPDFDNYPSKNFKMHPTVNNTRAPNYDENRKPYLNKKNKHKFSIKGYHHRHYVKNRKDKLKNKLKNKFTNRTNFNRNKYRRKKYNKKYLKDDRYNNVGDKGSIEYNHLGKKIPFHKQTSPTGKKFTRNISKNSFENFDDKQQPVSTCNKKLPMYLKHKGHYRLDSSEIVPKRKKIIIRDVVNQDYCKFVSSFSNKLKCPKSHPIHTGATFSSTGSNISCGQKNIKVKSAHAIAIVKDGKLKSIRVIDGGEKYSDTPKVYIRGVGKNARAMAHIKDGKVIEIEVVSPGTGYISTPAVIIEKPNVVVYCNLCCKDTL